MLFFDIFFINLPLAIVFGVAVYLLNTDNVKENKLFILGIFLILLTGVLGVPLVDYIINYHTELTTNRYFITLVSFSLEICSAIGLWLCLKAYISKK